MSRRNQMLCQVVLSTTVLLGLVGITLFAAPTKPLERRLPDEIGARVYVYENDASPGRFIPSGWMPDGQGISQNTKETDSPHTKPHYIRLGAEFSNSPWVGIYFLLDEKWEPKSPFNLFEELGAKQGDPIKCRFWARSKQKASVQFKVGGVTKGKISDSLRIPVSTRYITLTPDWKMYEIDLTGRGLNSLVGAFVWVSDRGHNRKSSQISFDLDTIYFVKVKKR
jgi:hypothetical protein